MSVIRKMIGDAIVDAEERDSVIKPYVLSHGTLECRNLYRSRRFYEEFLGLECVVHSPSSMGIRCGMKFHIIAVEVGDSIQPSALLNHWGLDLRTREEVEQAYEDVLAAREEWGIPDVQPLIERHGVYGFYFQDFDGNWWEIEHYPGFLHEDMFDFGNRYQLEEPKS